MLSCPAVTLASTPFLAVVCFLRACGDSIERAADWLFSHMDDLDSAVAKVMSASSSSSAPAVAAAAGGPSGAGAAASGSASGSRKEAFVDGSGRYELVSFISHMGSNLGCGHYVCHVKKDGRWAAFLKGWWGPVCNATSSVSVAGSH